MEQTNRPGTSPDAIRLHYDSGNEFFSIWLDDTMSYSCALWDGEGDTLEEAQRRKTDYLIAETRVAGKGSILDVGCGWGPVLDRATRVHDVGRAVGLTLSEPQAAWVHAQDNARVEARVENWLDHVPDARYDGIVIVGTIEHFARRDQESHEKVAAYRHFFKKCHEWLRPGGWLCVQAICYGTMRPEDFNSFIAKEIFPEADLPRLAELAEASERLFEITKVTNDRRGYRRTCQEWLDRLQVKRDRAVEVAGIEQVERFELYLNLCVKIFQVGASVLHRITFRRIGRE